MADNIATEVKAGHMAGPLPMGLISNGKVDGLILVEKPDGSRRQVCNLSAPKGEFFNDGIREDALKDWRVLQTTAADLAFKVA